MPSGDRPEYRVIGKMVVFRGTAIVPLSSTINGLTLVNMTGGVSVGGFYVNSPYAFTFEGTNGCVVNNNGSITFNGGNSVFQSAITLDDTYQKGLTICSRTVKTSEDNTGANLGTVFNPIITSAGLLTIVTYKDIEVSQNIPDGGNGLGLGTLRPIVAKVNAGQFVPDYRFMTNQPNPSETNSSKVNTGLTVDYKISVITNTFLFDVDSTDPFLIGGFTIPLGGLIGYIA
jgi:hypothetical protein